MAYDLDGNTGITNIQAVIQKWIDQGISANLPNLIQELLLRDKADAERLISPLIPAKDAIIIDTSDISAEEAFDITINIIKENLKNL